MSRKQEVLQGQKWVLFVKCYHNQTTTYLSHLIVSPGDPVQVVLDAFRWPDEVLHVYGEQEMFEQSLITTREQSISKSLRNN